MQSGFYLAIGKQGSGKTCFITKLLVDNFDNRKIFSNYSLYKFNYQKITVDKQNKNDDEMDLIEQLEIEDNFFNNGIILMDEIHIYLNSLDFFKNTNRTLHTFFSQLRKRNILLLGTTQYLLNVDVRIRRQCFNIFEMEQLKSNNFRVNIFEIDGYYSKFIKSKVMNLEEYYEHYDTREIIT